MTIQELVLQLTDLGVNTAGIRVALKAKGFDSDAIDEACPKKPKISFAKAFYTWIAESERSAEEVKEFIMNPENSDNTHKHLTHYEAIANMAREIWAVKELEEMIEE